MAAAQAQAALDQQWRQLLANDPGMVIAVLAEAFEGNEAPAAPSAPGPAVSEAGWACGTAGHEARKDAAVTRPWEQPPATARTDI